MRVSIEFVKLNSIFKTLMYIFKQGRFCKRRGMCSISSSNRIFFLYFMLIQGVLKIPVRGFVFSPLQINKHACPYIFQALFQILMLKLLGKLRISSHPVLHYCSGFGKVNQPNSLEKKPSNNCYPTFHIFKQFSL